MLPLLGCRTTSYWSNPSLKPYLIPLGTNLVNSWSGWLARFNSHAEIFNGVDMTCRDLSNSLADWPPLCSKNEQLLAVGITWLRGEKLQCIADVYLHCNLIYSLILIIITSNYEDNIIPLSNHMGRITLMGSTLRFLIFGPSFLTLTTAWLWVRSQAYATDVPEQTLYQSGILHCYYCTNYKFFSCHSRGEIKNTFESILGMMVMYDPPTFHSY